MIERRLVRLEEECEIVLFICPVLGQLGELQHRPGQVSKICLGDKGIEHLSSALRLGSEEAGEFWMEDVFAESAISVLQPFGNLDISDPLTQHDTFPPWRYGGLGGF